MIPNHFINLPGVGPVFINAGYYNPYMSPTFHPIPFPGPSQQPYQLSNQNYIRNEPDLREDLQDNSRREKSVPKINKRQEKRAQEQDEYKTKTQNSQRNIMSNIAHHLMSYLKKSSRVRPILEKIIKIHELAITPQDFSQFVSKIELKNYIRIKLLKQEWTPEKSGQPMAKALRIMVYYFLNQKYFLWIQCSRKIKATVKANHMVKRRDFIKIVKSGK